MFFITETLNPSHGLNTGSSFSGLPTCSPIWTALILGTCSRDLLPTPALFVQSTEGSSYSTSFSFRAIRPDQCWGLPASQTPETRQAAASTQYVVLRKGSNKPQWSTPRDSTATGCVVPGHHFHCLRCPPLRRGVIEGTLLGAADLLCSGKP